MPFDFLGVSKARINDDFLDQVAASQVALQVNQQASAAANTPQSTTGTQNARQRAQEFLRTYFPTNEDDA